MSICLYLWSTAEQLPSVNELLTGLREREINAEVDLCVDVDEKEITDRESRAWKNLMLVAKFDDKAEQSGCVIDATSLEADEFDEELRNDETLPEARRNARQWLVIETDENRYDTDWPLVKETTLLLRDMLDGVVEDPTNGEFLEDLEEM